MPIKSPQRLRRRDIPEKDGFIPADGREARVVGRDAEVEDFVAVRRVCLDQARGGGVEEADAAVLAAGKDVLACAGGEGDGVDGAVVVGQAGDGRCWERFGGHVLFMVLVMFA